MKEHFWKHVTHIVLRQCKTNPCFRCGGFHNEICPAIGKICKKCNYFTSDTNNTLINYGLSLVNFEVFGTGNFELLQGLK